MLRKLFLRLPTSVRHPLMRRMFRFDPDRCERYEVRPAKTADEYVAAFQLVCREYEAGGFFDTGDWRRQSGGRLYFPHTVLPTSTVVVALLGDKVVGTTTMIRDSALGLPGNKSFGEATAPLAARGLRLSEMSMLAVEPEHRTGGAVLFALQRYAALATIDYEGIDRAVATMQVVIADALRGLLMFDTLLEKPLVHPLARTKIAALSLDCKTVEERSRRYYRDVPRERDLRRFIFTDGRARVRFPASPWRTTLQPKLGPLEFAAAFGDVDDLYAPLSERERLVIHNAFSPAFRAALPAWFPPSPARERETRYDANVPVRMTGDRPGVAQLEQVSAHGALLATSVPLRVGEVLQLEAKLAPDRSARVQARVVRVANTRQYGIAVAAPDDTWSEYVRFLETWLWGIAPVPAQPREEIERVH